MAGGSGAALWSGYAPAWGGDPALGRVWDAGRGMWVDRPRIPHPLDVNGLPVPVRESVITGDPATSGAEQDMLGTQVPTAVQAERDTQAAMQQAHQNLAEQ